MYFCMKHLFIIQKIYESFKIFHKSITVEQNQVIFLSKLVVLVNT